MVDLVKLKEQLIDYCELEIQNKRKVLESLIKDAQQSANSETKSTAGDKHDTARAMAHLEQEKNSQQLKVLKDQERAIDELKKTTESKKASFGSLVKTNKGIYFIGLGLGKLEINNQQVFSISPISPIALKLKDLEKGSKFEFNGNEFTIETII